MYDFDDKEEKYTRGNALALGILFLIVAALCLLSLFGALGSMGKLISSFLLGVMGQGAYGMAFALGLTGIFVASYRKIQVKAGKAIKYVVLYALGMLALQCATSKNYINIGFGEYLKTCFNNVNTAGGVFYGVFAYPLMKMFTPTWVIIVSVIACFAVALISIYPYFNGGDVIFKSKVKVIKDKTTVPTLIDFAGDTEVPIATSLKPSDVDLKIDENMINIQTNTKQVKDEDIDENIVISKEILLKDKEAQDKKAKLKEILNPDTPPQKSKSIIDEINRIKELKRKEAEESSNNLNGDTSEFKNIILDITKKNKDTSYQQKLIEEKFFKKGEFVEPDYPKLAEDDFDEPINLNITPPYKVREDDIVENVANDAPKLKFGFEALKRNTDMPKPQEVAKDNLENDKAEDLDKEVNKAVNEQSSQKVENVSDPKGYDTKESFDKINMSFGDSKPKPITRENIKPNNNIDLNTTRLEPEKPRRSDYKQTHNTTSREDYFMHSAEAAAPEPIVAPHEPDYKELLETVVTSSCRAPYMAPSDIFLKDYDEDAHTSSEDYEENVQKINDFLDEFRIDATIENYVQGPTFSRYDLKLARGIKASAVLSQKEDIVLKLGNVRLIPLPGQNLIGLEIPNNQRGTVGMKPIINSRQFNNPSGALTFAIGKDIVGDIYVRDLAELPHLLIGGTTGSGKSIAINVIITSLLYKYSPDELRFIFIDPKKVELNMYNGIPHMLVPNAIYDTKMCVNALKWACSEMDRRLALFAKLRVRNIFEYLEMVDDEHPKMPRIVIVIDEFADMMATSEKLAIEIESSITRLTSVARAAGIHLILATQRPVVKYVTGNIKANVPARIGFAVKNAIDSRIILDESGAEELLGKGDMLMVGERGRLLRLQGAFLSNAEISGVISYIIEHNPTQFNEKLASDITVSDEPKTESGGMDFGGMSDDSKMDAFFLPALKKAIEEGQVSASKLQRYFSVGYNRAAKMIDDMEYKGFIAPAQGNKPREVLINMDEYNELFGEDN